MIPFTNLLGADVFCVSQVVAYLMNLTYWLCYPCGFSSMAYKYLTQTLPLDAVSFLTYGLMIADVGPIWQNNIQAQSN